MVNSKKNFFFVNIMNGHPLLKMNLVASFFHHLFIFNISSNSKFVTIFYKLFFLENFHQFQKLLTQNFPYFFLGKSLESLNFEICGTFLFA